MGQVSKPRREGISWVVYAAVPSKDPIKGDIPLKINYVAKLMPLIMLLILTPGKNKELLTG